MPRVPNSLRDPGGFSSIMQRKRGYLALRIWAVAAVVIVIRVERHEPALPPRGAPFTHEIDPGSCDHHDRNHAERSTLRDGDFLLAVRAVVLVARWRSWASAGPWEVVDGVG